MVNDVVIGLVCGAAVCAALAAGVVVLEALEGWRWSPERGALGTLGHSLRRWRRRGGDHHRGTAVLATLMAILPPFVAAAIAVLAPLSPLLPAVVCALLLPSTVAPVLAALSADSTARARLSLDDALARTARSSLLVATALVVSTSSWFAVLGPLLVVSLWRAHHPGGAGLKPSADAALGTGTELLLHAGRRATVLVVTGLVANSIASALCGPQGMWGVPTVVVAAGCAVVVLWGSLRLIEWQGPLGSQGLGSRGPLLLLALAAAVRLTGLVSSPLLAVDAPTVDASPR
jgi:hypothetical protein